MLLVDLVGRMIFFYDAADDGILWFLLVCVLYYDRMAVCMCVDFPNATRFEHQNDVRVILIDTSIQYKTIIIIYSTIIKNKSRTCVRYNTHRFRIVSSIIIIFMIISPFIIIISSTTFSIVILIIIPISFIIVIIIRR